MGIFIRAKFGGTFNGGQVYGDLLPGYGSLEIDGNPNDIQFIDNWIF